MSELRAGRVANGSRRKRDLAAVGLTAHTDQENAKRAAEAVRQQEREERLRPRVAMSQTAEEAWADTRAALEASVPASTFGLWLEPLRCIGEVDGALAVEAPFGIFEWCRRRYGNLLGRAVRESTDLRGAFLFRASPTAADPQDGLL